MSFEKTDAESRNVPHQSKRLTPFPEALMRRKEGGSSFSEGYDPELPVLKSAGFYVFIELLLHVVEAVPPDGDACLRQLLLTQAVKTTKAAGG